MNRVGTLLMVLLLLGVGGGFAQKKKSDENTRNVQGFVTAPDDSLVTGARVYLENTKTLQVRTFYTQKDGAYHFSELSTTVDYKLRAEYQGIASPSRTLSSFDTRKDAVLNLKLTLRNQ